VVAASSLLFAVLIADGPLLAPPTFEVAVPGGTPALARAAGLDGAIERWRLLPDLTRRLHAPFGERTAARVTTRVAAALAGTTRLARADGPSPAARDGDDARSAVVDEVAVPVPLTPALWDRILGRDRDGRPRDVLTAIATDGNAARLYRGLVTLDGPALAALAAEPDVLREIYRHHTDAFSAFAGSFRVDRGRVLVPGGHGEAPLWQDLVGASVLRPGDFLLRLLSSGQGRSFLLYDSIDRLDDAHRRFALDTAEPDGSRRLARAHVLQAVFALADPWWQTTTLPFSRPVADASRVLEVVRVTSEGRLAFPDRQLFWAAAFDDQVDASAEWRTRLAESAPADAAWLVERIAGAPPSVARRRLDLLAFGQRLMADAREEDPALLLQALRGFSRYPALALGLERMGIRDPAVHAAAARTAEHLDTLGHGERARAALAAFQGALAIVERSVQSATLDAARAAALVRSLSAVPLEHARDGEGVARWITADLLPALRAALSLAEPASAETTVLRAMAGPPDPLSRARLEWEGLAYHVDPPLVEYRRLRALRARQGGPPLDDALAGDARGREARLAAVLVDLAYAAALGPAEGAPAASEDVARRHEFGLEEPAAAGGPRPAWDVPREIAGPGQRWHARGALLGLDIGLARLALRRLDTDVPPLPVLDAADRRAFAEGAVVVRVSRLDDEGRDAIASALARGRARLAAAAGDPEGLRGIADELRLRDWRRGLLPWIAAHDPAHLESAFTVGEVFRLGLPGGAAPALAAWGTSARGNDACLCADLRPLPALDALSGRAADGRLAALAPDLHLRVAELLAERKLPARLAPGVLSLALQDLMDQSRPAFLDDALAIARFARAIDGERMEDYVAALAGRGPLVPAAEP